MPALKIAPSILSADFSRLQDEIDTVKNADWLHIDVMDGHFVPNITIGPVVIKKLKTPLKKDVHLMITEPRKYAPAFVEAGADSITFHANACKSNAERKKTVHFLKRLNIQVGVALNPDNPLSMIDVLLDDVDMVVLMTVFPGFGGQKFMPSVLAKIKELRNLKPGMDIQVDGGITDKTAQQVVAAGANILVAGSFIFSHKDHGQAVELLRRVGDID
ncbi:ribulose-phosphate 3-epimerase [Candidatus Woesearchaeota archaeon]|nr:ribulose-phosphate 3-epimerase [Candidatus Woesearchaeota archaeon]